MLDYSDFFGSSDCKEKISHHNTENYNTYKYMQLLYITIIDLVF